MRALLAVVLCCLGCAAHGAQGDHHSVSYSIWTVSGPSVLVKILLPVDEAHRLVGVDVPVLTTKKLGDYVLRHTSVQAGGRDCPAVDQGYDLGRVDPLAVGPDLYGFELLFRCPSAAALTLNDSVLFERVPEHVNFARVEKAGRSAQQLFTADRQRLPVADSGPLPDAGIGSYIRLGAIHMLHSLDRLCLLLGSLLLIRRGRDAGFLVAGLIAGYAAALAVTAGDWILPRITLLEAFIGLLPILLAGLIILRELRQPRIAALGCPAVLLALAIAAALTHAHWQALMLCGAALFAAGLLAASRESATRRFRWMPWVLPVAVLGFLDGFLLPSLLAPMGVTRWPQLRMVAGFDSGAAATAALLLGLALAALALLRRRQLAPPRQAVNEIAAAALGGCGAFWLLSRLYS